MRKKTRVGWSAEALEDLKRLQRNVADEGAPRTAKSFVRRLRKYASDRLRDFPQSGAVVEEYNDPSVRDICFKDQ